MADEPTEQEAPEREAGPTFAGPKPLRDAYERVKDKVRAYEERYGDLDDNPAPSLDEVTSLQERIEQQGATIRKTTMDQLRIKEEARDHVLSTLGDDADWSDPEAIKTAIEGAWLTAAFEPAGEDEGGRHYLTAEDHERIAAQSRMDEMRSTGFIPSGGPPSVQDQIADAESRGDLTTVMNLKSQQMLSRAGVKDR